MTDATKSLLDAALKLSPRERAALAHDLLVSLEVEAAPGDVDTGWADEAEKRAKKLLSGEDPGQAWDDVCGRLFEEFGL